jgi:hypothetical protein
MVVIVVDFMVGMKVLVVVVVQVKNLSLLSRKSRSTLSRPNSYGYTKLWSNSWTK